jgi:hypothetical protein
VKIFSNTKVKLMKSILFIAFLAIATIGCDTPESSTGTDTSSPPMSDTATTQPSGTGMDTSATVPTDTTTTMPTDTTTTSPNPTTDTTTTQ